MFVPISDYANSGATLYDGQIAMYGGVTFTKPSKAFMKMVAKYRAYERRTKHIRERWHRLKGRRG